MMPVRIITILVLIVFAGCSAQPPVRQAQRKQADGERAVQTALIDYAPVTADRVSRVTTAVPFPRGLVIIDDKLYVLARGRVRESGGADGKIDDQAGTIFVVDAKIGESIDQSPSERIRANGKVFAAPTEPPFKLFDRNASPATSDRETDRPYCSLRYDPGTKNFFLCAFSGIDKPEAGDGKPGGSTFSKNTSDGLHRFDTRDGKWRVVEKHNLEAGGNYPHHDPASRPPPHGRLNGPDNCLVVGKWLYAVAKDNSLLARYDLSEIARNPAAPPPQSEWILDHKITIDGKLHELHGHSMLAYRDGWLYVGYRTSSAIVRIAMMPDGEIARPMKAEMIARFDPYDPQTRQSANLTDMSFGPDGDLYVISAQPSRVYRFRPDPMRVFDGRTGRSAPWADLAALTDNPKMKSENVLVDDAGRVIVTSGDAYAYQNGGGGTVYRIDQEESDER
jgi:hypothetical protein